VRRRSGRQLDRYRYADAAAWAVAHGLARADDGRRRAKGLDEAVMHGRMPAAADLQRPPRRGDTSIGVRGGDRDSRRGVHQDRKHILCVEHLGSQRATPTAPDRLLMVATMLAMVSRTVVRRGLVPSMASASAASSSLACQGAK
jgi:hypothetical protein